MIDVHASMQIPSPPTWGGQPHSDNVRLKFPLGQVSATSFGLPLALELTMLRYCAVVIISVAALLSRAAPPPETKQLSFAVLEDYDKGEDLREAALDFAAMNELQIHTWRGSFGWDDYEPSRGKFDFKWLHRFADLAAKRGITLRPYIGYTPQWAAKGGSDKDAWNDPPNRIAEWREFVYRLANAMRRHANIASYEIYNEENTKMWWDGSAPEYNMVLSQGAAAVADTKARVQILFGGMVWPDVNWIEQACRVYKNATKFDVVPFHAYPETWTPPEVTVENYLGEGYTDQFLPTIDRDCGPKKIWINETGFATTPGKSEVDQANWWARAIATFAATPRVEHIGIYEIKDAPRDKPVIGDAPNYYLGILYRDRRKKLAFRTIRALVDFFKDRKFTVTDAEVTNTGAGRLFQHVFVRDDGTQLVFVWDKTASPTVDARLPQSGSTATEIKLDGERIAYSDFQGNTLKGIRLAPGMVRIFMVR